MTGAFSARRSFEAGDGVLERLHFREGNQECQRRFRTLVLAQPVHVQPIPATPCAWIVQRESQIVSAQEPLESSVRLRDPKHVTRPVKRLDTGGYRHLRLDRLLIEQRALLSARIESI